MIEPVEAKTLVAGKTAQGGILRVTAVVDETKALAAVAVRVRDLSVWLGGCE